MVVVWNRMVFVVVRLDCKFGLNVLIAATALTQGMFGYALRHPLKSANPGVVNKQDLTCLTLSCMLGRDEIFKEMLELSCKEFWR